MFSFGPDFDRVLDLYYQASEVSGRAQGLLASSFSGFAIDELLRMNSVPDGDGDSISRLIRKGWMLRFRLAWVFYSI